MSIYQNLMGQLSDQHALFNVSTDRLTTLSGIEVPNKKCIINNHNGKVIGIVGERYKVVPNEEVFDAFCKSVEASDIDHSDAQVKVSFAKNGARTLVDFVFPNEEVKVPGDNSSTALNITSLNSFDGTTRFLTKAGGLRMRCLNGQLLGTIAGSYSSTHSDKLNIDEGAAKVVEMLQRFRSAQDYWGGMLQTRVNDKTAFTVITEFFGKEDLEDPFKNKDVSLVHQLWKQYANEMGSNSYALYNALTDWVSHKESKTGATGRLVRERRLNKALDTVSVFKPVEQLALAA